MKLFFISIGKTKDKNLKDLADDYIGRIKRYIPAEIIELREPKGISPKDTEKIIREEGCLFEDNIKDGYTIVMDERGKPMTTVEFAQFLSKRFDSGIKQINFLIGGPFGLSKEIKEKSDEIVSLSKLTFTHEMSRVILLEQIYRALTILRGEKYHY